MSAPNYDFLLILSEARKKLELDLKLSGLKLKQKKYEAIQKLKDRKTNERETYQPH